MQSRVLHARLVQQKLQRLSASTEDLLEKCLLTHPGITHELINHLLCDTSFFESTNSQLKEIYMSAIKNCIESIQNGISVEGTVVVFV